MIARPTLATLLTVLLAVGLMVPVAPVASVASTASAASADGVHRADGPRLAVPRDQLRRSVRCTRRASQANRRRTVLLVHGTASTPAEAWGWGYQRQLAADGFGVCTVRLPNRARGDFTISAEYAVFAARRAHQRSGRKIAIVGHSQGGAMALWIAKFWPDVARHASDVVSLAGPLRGTQVVDDLCAVRRCAPLAWQLRLQARTMHALATAPMPRRLAVTSIATRFDELVMPQPYASQARGARTILLQDICPGRVVEHGGILGDPVGYALLRDAMSHRGTARPGRVDSAVCSEQLLSEADPVGAAGFANTVAAFVTGLANPLLWVGNEPTLPPYARRYGR